MKYTLALDDKGRRYWLCVHANGEQEPMPPDFSLTFFCDVREVEGEKACLPLGTEIELRMPANPEEAEREAIIRVLVAAIRAEHPEINAEKARALVLKTTRELLDGSKAPAFARVP